MDSPAAIAAPVITVNELHVNELPDLVGDLTGVRSTECLQSRARDVRDPLQTSRLRSACSATSRESIFAPG